MLLINKGNKLMPNIRKITKYWVKTQITEKAKKILRCPVCRIWTDDASGQQTPFGVGLGGEDPLNQNLTDEQKIAMATSFVKNMVRLGELQNTGALIPPDQWEELKWSLVSFNKIGRSFFESVKSAGNEYSEDYKYQNKWFVNFRVPDWA